MILGSFAGAQVWRLRARQLREDTDRLRQLQRRKRLSAAEKLERQELLGSRAQRSDELGQLAPLLKETLQTDRSRCLSCQHRLAWYDLIPVISWFSTAGRCRYCQAPIGWFELLIETGLGLFFVLSWVWWPLPLDSLFGVAMFVVWLVASLPLTVLLAYDAKWFLLPDRPMISFLAAASIFAVLGLVSSGVSMASLLSLLGAIMTIGGLYWLLHWVSGGRWVGYGDATLGAGLGLLLGQWQLAVLAVVLANTIGTAMVLPGLLTGRLDRKTHIPFGPMLIIGTVITFFIGQPIIDWYFGLL